MTVSNTSNEWSYAGDGATTDFAYQNKIFASTDLKVYLDQVLQGSGYSVTNIGNPAGGLVQFVAAPAAGVTVKIVRDLPTTQPTDYINGGPIDLETLEAGFDRKVILLQQAESLLLKSLALQDGDPETALARMPLLSALAGKYLGFSSDSPPVPVALDAPAGTTALSAFGAQLGVTPDAAAARVLLDAMPHGYAPGVETPLSMKTTVAAGSFFNLATGAIVSNALQTTAAFSAPAINPRNDIVWQDRLTGAIGVAAGAEAAVPADPAIPAGTVPNHRVRLTVGMAQITAADIDDLRELHLMGTGTAATKNTGTAAGEVMEVQSGGRAPAVIGTLGRAVTADKTAGYTITAADVGSIVPFDCTVAARTATLPQLSAVGEGFGVGIVRAAGANAITVNQDAGDGGATVAFIAHARIVWIAKASGAWALFGDDPVTLYDFSDATDVSFGTSATGWSAAQNIVIPAKGIIEYDLVARLQNGDAASRNMFFGLLVNGVEHQPSVNVNGAVANPFANLGASAFQEIRNHGTSSGGIFGAARLVLDIEDSGMATGAQSVQPSIKANTASANHTLKGTVRTSRARLRIWDYS